MKKKRKARGGPPVLSRLDAALVRVIGNTHRTKRKRDLLTVARNLAIVEKELGSRKAAAERLGLSPEMLREFARVTKLSPEVKDIIRQGGLTSVDVAYRISMLAEDEHLPVAQGFRDGEITGRDVKDIVSYRRRRPEIPLARAIERVRSSRDTVEYVVRFRMEAEPASRQALRAKLEACLGKHNVVSLVTRGTIVTLVVTAAGQKTLVRLAQEQGVTKRAFVTALARRA